MHHLIGSKEPIIHLSIDSNTSIAAKTFGNQACSNFTISDVNMSKQRRIKHSSDRTQWRRFATNQPNSQLRMHSNMISTQQNRPSIASTHVAVSNGVDDKSHSMSNADVGIQSNEGN
jgi:hypothetical protein